MKPNIKKGTSPQSNRACPVSNQTTTPKEEKLRDSDCEYWYQKGLKASKEKIEELHFTDIELYGYRDAEIELILRKLNQVIREVNKFKI
jgi:hypothetical protein